MHQTEQNPLQEKQTQGSRLHGIHGDASGNADATPTALAMSVSYTQWLIIICPLLETSTRVYARELNHAPNDRCRDCSLFVFPGIDSPDAMQEISGVNNRANTADDTPMLYPLYTAAVTTRRLKSRNPFKAADLLETTATSNEWHKHQDYRA